jgi:predicted nucleotidyltransferase
MTEQKPKLKLKLSGEAMLKLQARIPKPPAPKIKAHEVFTVSKAPKTPKAPKFKKKVKQKDNKKEQVNLTEGSLNVKQYFFILKSLQKTHKIAFPPKTKPAVPLAIGIHKEIAKLFNISIKKAFYFCRMYCGTKRYKEAVSKSGIPRMNLAGKKAGSTD